MILSNWFLKGICARKKEKSTMQLYDVEFDAAGICEFFLSQTEYIYPEHNELRAAFFDGPIYVLWELPDFRLFPTKTYREMWGTDVHLAVDPAPHKDSFDQSVGFSHREYYDFFSGRQITGTLMPQSAYIFAESGRENYTTLQMDFEFHIDDADAALFPTGIVSLHLEKYRYPPSRRICYRFAIRSADQAPEKRWSVSYREWHTYNHAVCRVEGTAPKITFSRTPFTHDFAVVRNAAGDDDDA